MSAAQTRPAVVFDWGETPMLGHDGRRRAVVERVRPAVDGGRFAVKRVTGDTLEVEADAFADGHDELVTLLLYRRPGEEEWRAQPMTHQGNDRWTGRLALDAIGRWSYAVEARVDHFRTWRRDLAARVGAGEDVTIELRVGEELARAAAARAGQRPDGEADARALLTLAAALARADGPSLEVALEGQELPRLMERHPDRALATRSDALPLTVDRERARCGAWYELFPRSLGERGQHGTLRDVEGRLHELAEMGVDVLYLPPIHPIGRAHRKGPNNALVAGPHDPGSPWAIGAAEGGHTAIHPQLGTLADFRRLVEAAAGVGIELALDIAFQCSPDHPWVAEHPEWFRRRPDGSIRPAENPPKKYQDIYPFEFEGQAWSPLWDALLGVVRFWVDQGVRVFRVDNPHTKPFPLWEWLIGQVKAHAPDTLFLAEAFTRPKVMHRLAKLGFTQSYTYFTWRNTKQELIDYLRELTEGPGRDYFRPNFWPNTPDILPELLQLGGRPAFVTRLVLAATLASSYGIYGPAYELCEARPLAAGKEEYLDSEKYELKAWEREAPGSLRGLYTRLNAIRRAHPALQGRGRLRFQAIDDERLLAYTWQAPGESEAILVVANLDPHQAHAATLRLDLPELTGRAYEARDLLADSAQVWQGRERFLELTPTLPARVWHLRPRARTEQDFEYYLA